MNWLSGIFGLLGQGIQGIFGAKQAQADLIKTSIGVLGQAMTTDAQKQQAVASIFAADATSDSWLTRSWRPLLILSFLAFLSSWWFFGYVPPHFNDPLSPMMSEILDMMKWLMGIGMGSRGFEKIMSSLAMSGVLKQFLNKGI